MTARESTANNSRRKEAFYAISADESTRIKVWRLWLALLVIFAHASTNTVRVGGENVAALVIPNWLSFVNYVLTIIIARCTTPAFSLISAVLLFRKPFVWRTNAARKFKSMMIPLFLLTSFWVALYAVGPYIPGLRALFSSQTSRVVDWTPRQWFAAYLGWTPEHATPTLLYPLWFLRDLMLMHLIAPAIKWIIDRIPRLFLCALAVLLVIKTDSDFHFYTIHQIFIFFCLGYYAVKYDLHLSDLDRIPWAAIAGLYALTIAGGYLARAYFDDISAVRGIPNLVGVLFFARCTTKIRDGKWLRMILWLSEYTIAIYLFQERMLGFSKKLLLRVLPASVPTTLVIFYVLPAIIAALCVLIAWLLRRYQPRFYSLITGTR